MRTPAVRIIVLGTVLLLGIGVTLSLPLAGAPEAEASILVGQCLSGGACTFGGGAPWSFTFSPSELGIFGTGSVELDTIQTAPVDIRLGVTTLDLGFSDATTASPTLPEFNYTDDKSGPYPSPDQVVGDFTYTIPSEATVTSASISGTFGTLIALTSAPSDVCIAGPCPTVVPEPSTVALMASGLFGLVGLGRRKYRRRVD